MIDLALKQKVLDELAWQPGFDESDIGVTVRGGFVTLSGHVKSYVEKYAAERAAGRVTGVRAIADEIEVRVRHLSSVDHDDAELAKRAFDVISWDLSVPKNRVKIKIEKGWVILEGDVDWHFQKQAAEADIRNLPGVMGVINAIEIKPKAKVSNVEQQIKAAFRRNAEFEAENIVITLDGRAVTLTGQVGSYHERTLAADTAWSAPGVAEVHDLMTVDQGLSDIEPNGAPLELPSFGLGPNSARGARKVPPKIIDLESRPPRKRQPTATPASEPDPIAQVKLSSFRP
jgi:osmotically-inducible protein OsmY